jgi:hypothetical protein
MASITLSTCSIPVRVSGGYSISSQGVGVDMKSCFVLSGLVVGVIVMAIFSCELQAEVGANNRVRVVNKVIFLSQFVSKDLMVSPFL